MATHTPAKVTSPKPTTLALKEEAPAPRNPNAFNRRNDINPPRHVRQLAKLDLELDSPRMKQALDNLGVETSEMQIW
jgi:hypothetical protein